MKKTPTLAAACLTAVGLLIGLADSAIASPTGAPASDPGSKSGTWTYYKGKLPFSSASGVSILLTDGTVLVLNVCTSNWFKLTPDNKGRYETGSWSQVADMPGGYIPYLFASEILPDGRLIVNGGEYNAVKCGSPVFTNQGALYDPVADTWTTVSPPTGWKNIGDAPSAILPNGSYMLAEDMNFQEAIATISGTNVTWTSTGSGKGDFNFEEGWTLLPDGNILTVDTNRPKGIANYYEIYNTVSGTWSTPGQTAQVLVSSSAEIGPAVLRPDGNVIQFGATGHNDIYNTISGSWTAGPDFPVIGGAQYEVSDGSAVLLPGGNVLVHASPGGKPPSHFFEFSMNAKGQAELYRVDDPKESNYYGSQSGYFLELPTGQILFTDVINEVAVYTPKGSPKAEWLPVVSSVATTLVRGSTANSISGKKFNGYSQGSAYGDDAQQATNYPLVRFTNTATGDVCFGRSYDFSTMGVWTKGTTSALFDIPNSCESGASTLQVVVNGLASKGTAVTLQ